MSELLAWYDRERRDLPWRRTRDPYAILVSEVMLQQTRVEAVIPYYLRFLERFPDVGALASATLDSVYEMWAGLGYYRRARNLQATAQAVVSLGGFPLVLQDLPGVGEYTAAALASIAFGRPAVALDGNALRVWSRYFAYEGAVMSVAARRFFTERVLGLIPADRAGDFTQAVMELGARVCLARQPRCLVCPLQSGCAALARGLTESIPKPSVKARREKVALCALRIFCGDRVLLERRERDPFLAGQWVTPWFFEPFSQVGPDYLARFPGGEPRRVGTVSHGVTFRDLTIEVWEWETSRESCDEEQRWAGLDARLPRLASLVLELA
ncbi:MAG: A/G-specific adenine glycosylase [Candidatus Eremiobacteraeota bacterium]|nr:A/G-specific adenine glycosylase [Candidatus Eremiobacteraeota bacterium]MCW5871276.1 A/G-specific adenine glycosylase [Candidatus Eremiobacteraeota bacterium]